MSPKKKDPEDKLKEFPLRLLPRFQRGIDYLAKSKLKPNGQKMTSGEYVQALLTRHVQELVEVGAVPQNVWDPPPEEVSGTDDQNEILKKPEPGLRRFLDPQAFR